MPSFDRWLSSRWEEVEGMAEESLNRGSRDRGLPRVISVRSAPMIGRERQTAIYLQGVGGRRPRVPLDPERLEAAARKAMRADAYAYVKAGAGTEDTVRENRAAFARHRIVPRMLRGVERPDATVELFGRRLPSPFLLPPVGVLEL